MNISQPQLNNLPDGDLELLSAYIDNQLGASARAELERRLGAEPRLRAELEDLRATTSLLGGLEPVRPPRSFTLSPAQATRRRGFLPLAWAMQLGGGLTGLALVLLASLQMISSLGGSMAAAPAPAATAASMVAAAPAATQEPTMLAAAAAPMMAAAPTAAPAATEAPAPLATAAPESTPASASDAARQVGPATESMTNDSGGNTPQGAGAAATASAADIAASEQSAPSTQGPDTPPLPAAKVAPPEPTSPPSGLLFGLGVALLALALGSFIYTRPRR